MNKQQLIADLSAKTFVDFVGEAELKTETLGAKWYGISFREIVENKMTNRSIDFYVIDEGEETERAYYKDQEPKQSLASSIINEE